MDIYYGLQIEDLMGRLHDDEEYLHFILGQEDEDNEDD